MLQQTLQNYSMIIPNIGNNDCFANCIGPNENKDLLSNYSAIWEQYIRRIDNTKTWDFGMLNLLLLLLLLLGFKHSDTKEEEEEETNPVYRWLYLHLHK